MFKDQEFLNEVKLVIEDSFNSKHGEYTVKIAEQKIINGDQHIINGSNSNLNFGIQQDYSKTNHITESFNQTDDHSFNIGGDMANSSIQAGTSNSEAIVKENRNQTYEWKEITTSLENIVKSIKIDSPVKQASQEALVAAQTENIGEFEAVIKNHRAEFLSDLFQNTVSGVLAQVISKILGIA